MDVLNSALQMLYHSIRMNGSLTSPPPQHVPDAEHLIELFRTLADPVRLRIVRLLESIPQPRNGERKGKNGTKDHVAAGGLSVGELGEILKLPQSTVSRHLKTLSDANLAMARREGTSIFYGLSQAAGVNASRQLCQMARMHLEHDATARNDSNRLAAVLRKRDSAEAFFGKHAPQWDQLRAQWFGDTFHLEGLLALLNPNWTVVDIGTGTGAMLPLLSPHVKQIVAVDPTTAMLNGARQRIKSLGLSNVEVKQGTAESLPLENATADVAMLTLVLAYTAEPAAVLREARRVLKPGGIVLMIDLQPHEVAVFREKLNHRWMGFAETQLRTWLEEAGFSEIRWHPVSPQKARTKEAGLPVPDLFVARGELRTESKPPRHDGAKY